MNREFLELKLNVGLESISYERLLSHHTQESFNIIAKIKLLKYFDEYLNFGAYPFFLEGEEQDYVMKLTTAINKTLESDLLQLFKIDPQNVSLLKKAFGGFMSKSSRRDEHYIFSKGDGA